MGGWRKDSSGRSRRSSQNLRSSSRYEATILLGPFIPACKVRAAPSRVSHQESVQSHAEQLQRGRRPAARKHIDLITVTLQCYALEVESEQARPQFSSNLLVVTRRSSLRHFHVVSHEQSRLDQAPCHEPSLHRRSLHPAVGSSRAHLHSLRILQRHRNIESSSKAHNFHLNRRILPPTFGPSSPSVMPELHRPPLPSTPSTHLKP